MNLSSFRTYTETYILLDTNLIILTYTNKHSEKFILMCCVSHPQALKHAKYSNAYLLSHWYNFLSWIYVKVSSIVIPGNVVNLINVYIQMIGWWTCMDVKGLVSINKYLQKICIHFEYSTSWCIQRLHFERKRSGVSVDIRE